MSDQFDFLLDLFLAHARERMTSYLSEAGEPKSTFLANALSARRYPQKELKKQLRELVAKATELEVGRLGPSRLLYSMAPANRSYTAIEKDALQDAFAPTVVERALQSRSSVSIDAKGASDQMAKKNYLYWVLGDRLPPWEKDIRVRAFFRRNPACRYALQKVTDNFVGNLLEAADRIWADRDAIRQVFFTASVGRLERIIPTGSDPHKRGRQVLILELRLGQTPPGNVQRLVYKPSDVEVDYRVIGANSTGLRKFLKDNEATNNSQGGFNYPIFTDSLFMRFDRLLLERDEAVAAEMVGEGDANETRRATLRNKYLRLPTYRVLPRNPLSRQNLVNGAVPLGHAYGYIEYLSHEPDLEQPPDLGTHARRQTLRYLNDQLVRNTAEIRRSLEHMDWVTDDPDRALATCRLWGRVMAIAFIAGIHDMHFENFRMWQNKPTLIDLETSFKLYPRIDGSGIPKFFREVVGTDLGSPTEFTKCFQYLLQHVNQTDSWAYVDPKDDDRLRQVFNGVTDVFDVIWGYHQQPVDPLTQNDNPIYSWLDESVGVVVRDLPSGTGIYRSGLLSSYHYAVREPNSAETAEVAALPLEEWRNFADRFRSEFDRRIGEARQAEAAADNPFETPDNDWFDYANFDIPFYCRRIGETDIRNSRGVPVNSNGGGQTGAAGYYDNHIPFDLRNRWQERWNDQGAYRAFLRSCHNRVDRPKHVIGAVQEDEPDGFSENELKQIHALLARQ